MLKEIAGLSGTIFEGISSTEDRTMASDWLTEHYQKAWLVNQVKGFLKASHNDPARAYDVINDVYVSLIKKEQIGEGYDSDDETYSVSQFVIGRLRLFSKNAMYGSNASQVASGNQGTYFKVVPASFDHESDTMDAFQLAYAYAKDYDDAIETVEDELSLKAQIQYCENFGEEHHLGINLRRLLKNLHLLSMPNIDPRYFEKLKDALRVNEDFADAFRSVVDFYQKHRDRYDIIIATI